MRKKGIGENRMAGDEQSAPKEEHETPSAEAATYPRPRSHRELGNAIFEESNPVKAGREILEESNDATRLNALKAFADWAYGERDGRANYKPPRIIWDIPGPPYEPQDPELLAAVAVEEEKLEGGEK